MTTERKVVVITGASKGIGAALVEAFRARDYRVAANARSISSAGVPEVLTVAGDIADPSTAERLISGALDRFGRVDTLINTNRPNG